jgi:putative FmdB family regulatory protein
MPIYDFECSACGAVFETMQPLSAPAPRCPACGGTVRRTLRSPPAVHGVAARGRQRAAASLPECGKGCRCCP